MRDESTGATSRREFLATAALAAASIAAAPHAASGESAPATPGASGGNAIGGARGAGEEFWRALRDEFLIPRDRIYLNVGTLGAQPRAVLEAAFQQMREVAASVPPALDWDALKNAVARVVDCDPAGLVFTRNATEAMNFVANGLELRAGDEVLTTLHEHVGGLCCWQLQAARRGVHLRQLELPVPITDPGDVVASFRRAITPRTRVISVSHVLFTTGAIMPVREIVQLCRERGIVSVVDGAHPPGLIPVRIRDIDPDFYASSTHKWLLAPQGSGILYLRDEWRNRLWPTIASGGWDDEKLGAHRFNHVGTLDESRLFGLLAAVDFHERVGAAKVYARIGELRARLAAALSEIRSVRIVSPSARGLAAGMVSFASSRLSGVELQTKLAERNVRTRVIGEYDYGWMRLSPHVWVMPEEIDRVVGMIAELG